MNTNLIINKKVKFNFAPPVGPPLTRSPTIHNISDLFIPSQAERDLVTLFRETMIHDIRTNLPNSREPSPILRNRELKRV